MSFSKTIQMFISDGNPNGRIMCELSNWNGRVYKISRNELSEFSQRDDSEKTLSNIKVHLLNTKTKKKKPFRAAKKSPSAKLPILKSLARSKKPFISFFWRILPIKVMK